MAIPIPSGAPSPLTGDLLIDAATTGYQWTLGADRTIDWSISGGFGGEFWNSPNAVQQYASAMLSTFSYYANVNFNYVGNFTTPTAAAQAGSEINFYVSASTSLFPSSSMWARAYFPTTMSNTAYAGAAGDVVLNMNSAANSLPSYDPGSAGWFVFIHEIGHALGLKHPFDDGGTGHPTLAELGLGQLSIDWATIMAYGDDYDYAQRAFDPATPMLLDVLALQHLYGPNMSTNAGSGVYNLTASNFYTTIWDASGDDEVSVEGSDRGWEIYLPDDKLSTLSPVNVGYALPTADTALPSPHTLYWLTGDIENATGSRFDDVIYGSVLNNQIRGLDGADYIDGWDGDDTIDGGAGDDDLFGGFGDDTISGASGVNYIRGEQGDDLITGGAERDDVNGNQGADTIDGGVGGTDWLLGGQGNDVIRATTGDVILNGNLGNDTVTGGSGADAVRGGQGDDILNAGAGNDRLFGDRGNDTMAGGSGADTFIFSAFGGADRVTDFDGAAGDRIQLDPGATYTLAQVGADAELTLAGGEKLVLAGVQSAGVAGWII